MMNHSILQEPESYSEGQATEEDKIDEVNSEEFGEQEGSD